MRGLIIFRGVPKEIREEVLLKVKMGEKAIALANQYGISPKTIYGWLSKESSENVISILKYNKLKRENEELKKLIGEITLQMNIKKK